MANSGWRSCSGEVAVDGAAEECGDDVEPGFVVDCCHAPHDPAKHAAGAVDVGGDSMVFVGDSPLDVEAACAAGVACPCVTAGYSASSELLKCKPAGVFEDSEAVTARILDS